MSIVRDVGDRIYIRYESLNSSGVLTDTTMALTVTDPSGNTTTPSVTHTSTGIYDAFFDATVAGKWRWKWTASVTVVDVQYGEVDVLTQSSPLYVTLDEFKDEMDIPQSNDTKDNVILGKLRSAQRQVNDDTARRFWLDSTVSQRIFDIHHIEMLAVDDIGSLTGLVVEVGSGTSWSTVDPLSYDPYGNDSLQPLTKDWPIEFFKRKVGYWPVGYQRRGYRTQQIRVTAQWGWPLIPEDIRNAVVLKAARLLRRKDSPEGIRGFSDFGVVRVTRYDPDYDNLIGPYVKGEV